MSYSSIVLDYQKEFQPDAKRYLGFFEKLTLDPAIEFASLCKLPSGKRHPHQYRIPRKALEQCYRTLLAAKPELANCKNFIELFDLIEERIQHIHGIGPLTVYDISHRLGAHLKLYPEHIYLHAGTTIGARNMGLNVNTKMIDPACFPREFQELEPYEIEDCLCLYSDQIARISSI